METLPKPNRGRRLLILVRWHEAGNWDLYRALADQGEKTDILKPFAYDRPFWNRISCTLSEFYLPLIAIIKKKPYDVVVTWSMRLGIFYGILNRLFGRSISPKHIMYDFHITLTRTDLLYRFRLKLLRLALPGIDFFLTTSEMERDIYFKRFGIKPAQIAFWPITPAGYLLDKGPYPREDYIFSYGNSDRDYDTLINAVEDIPFQTRILSKSYRPSRTLPPHVQLIRETSWIELQALIGSSRLVVIPLQSFWIAAGQLAMLETLALGRPLIVTSNMATIEYAEDRETALFFDAGDAGKLKDHIQFILSHSEIAEAMGNQARISVRKNAERRMKVFMGALDFLL
jgi:glycosyltransferase involved in cell wall biosynthesis